jgi:polysaccharide biosynthesis transport protein
VKHDNENSIARLPAAPPPTVGYNSVAHSSQEPEEPSREGVVAYWRMIMRHRWTVVLIAAIGLVAGIVFTLPQTPVYKARTSVEIQGYNENFLNFNNLTPTSAPGGYVDPSYEIMTQVKVLESSSLLEQVINRMTSKKDLGQAPTTDRLTAWRKLLHLQPKQALRPEDEIRAAAGSIQVKASGTTRIIDITADSTNPKLAADFANTLVDEFIQKNLNDRLKTTERTGEWLTGQLTELKVKLERSEDELQDYATSVGLQFTGNEKGKEGNQENVAEASVRLFQEELLKAKAERMATQSKFELISASPVEALPQVLDDPSLKDYQSKLTDLRRQLAELSSTLTPAHYKVQRVQAQIDELESALNAERKNVVTRLRNEFTAAFEHEKLLNDEFGRQLKTLSSQAAKEVHYNILKREVDTNRQLYESMLQKVKEANIASAMRASNFRIVDAARTPGSPYKPNLMNNALLGTMAGLFLGVVFVLIREQADRSIQQPGDSPLFLGLPELGVIPSERPLTLRRAQGSVKLATGEENDLEERVELVTWQRQRSLIAECFRTVLTSIMFSENGGRAPRVMVIASANPSEGKTTIATNLAIALSEIGHRVLLVDADMRRPRLHKLFEKKNDLGLSELLREKHSLEKSDIVSAARETWIPGLHVLTSGPYAANASTLLYSARLPELIHAARHSFDTVLIDSPPMLHIADARLLAKHADTVLLVLRAGRTTRAAATTARQKFAADGTPVLGTILTDWNPDQNGYGYNYKYYSSHAAYYTHGALTNGRPKGEKKS